MPKYAIKYDIMGVAHTTQIIASNTEQADKLADRYQNGKLLGEVVLNMQQGRRRPVLGIAGLFARLKTARL